VSLLIIADDLSGAADCAIGCSKYGLRTAVALQAQQTLPAGFDVIAADADSRRLSAGTAAQVHRQLYERLGGNGHLLYKKIDSTLRGNFAAEIAAVQPLAGMAIVAPAFPATGRTTHGGRQYLNGVPLEKTDIWRLEGITGIADLPQMLQAAGLSSDVIGLDIVRSRQQALQARLQACAAAGLQAVVCDAETDADLQAIAGASARLAARVFWVGSAGLACWLPEAAGLAVPGSRLPDIVSIPVEKPVLAMVGSLSEVSRRQAQCLREQASEDQLFTLQLDPAVLRGGEGSAAWQEAQRQASQALMDGRDLLLTIGREAQVNRAEGLRLCTALSRMVLPGFPYIGALVATGGETARAMLETAGLHGLHLAGEVEAGVPISLSLGRHQVPVVTKAGAFGSEQVLWNSYRFLKGQLPTNGLI
jgi:D-threonate/D-erythronate kinase